MRPVHPGRILKREIEARRLSANALAIALRTPSGRVTDILNGKRGLSPETAMRLARYFGNSAPPRPLLRQQRAVLAQFADGL
ncbi:HigA family addiction module antitoxin [Roseiarcus sp.]|uniref:HigA family addiction module antitoxin n=1 Tax=Roseiarcus sp. TaxID=1969460 RepID=UPI003D110F65